MNLFVCVLQWLCIISDKDVEHNANIRVFIKVQERELTALRDIWLFTDFISLCRFQLSRAPFQYQIIGYPHYVEAVAFLPKENRFPTERLNPITRFWGWIHFASGLSFIVSFVYTM